MSYFPENIWQGHSKSRPDGLADSRAPDHFDWEQIVSEVQAVQAYVKSNSGIGIPGSVIFFGPNGFAIEDNKYFYWDQFGKALFIGPHNINLSDLISSGLYVTNYYASISLIGCETCELDLVIYNRDNDKAKLLGAYGSQARYDGIILSNANLYLYNYTDNQYIMTCSVGETINFVNFGDYESISEDSTVDQGAKYSFLNDGPTHATAAFRNAKNQTANSAEFQADDKTVMLAIGPKGEIKTANAVNGSQLGSVVKRLEIFDRNGNSLGFIPIYSSID